MLCDMCSKGVVVYKADIEGCRLNVCEKCASFGKITSKVTSEQKKDRKQGQDSLQSPVLKQTETVQVIRTDYAKTIRIARERLGLKQEEMAKRIMEKESLLHNIESGHMKPSLELARKLEKFLRISIVEQIELEVGSSFGEKKKSSGLTIGDMLNRK